MSKILSEIHQSGAPASRPGQIRDAAGLRRSAHEVDPGRRCRAEGERRRPREEHAAFPDAEPYLKLAAQLEPFTAVTHYRLSLVYRPEGRTSDAHRELAEFQKLKNMKERLKQVYQEMRSQPVKQERQ